VCENIEVCENTVAAVMKQEGITASTEKKFRVTTTDSNHYSLPVAENVMDLPAAEVFGGIGGTNESFVQTRKQRCGRDHNAADGSFTSYFQMLCSERIVQATISV